MTNGAVPPDMRDPAGPVGRPRPPTAAPCYYLVHRVPVVTGRDLRNARADPRREQPSGGQLLAEAGWRHASSAISPAEHRPLARPSSSTSASSRRRSSRARINDEGRITGNFTQQEAQDLSLTLRSGALPASLTYLEERTVGPSLGADSIRAGVMASLVGLRPRRALHAGLLQAVRHQRDRLDDGEPADPAGLMVYFRATMTLPGIAGFILTIGMGVDSNVLIFERIKEELLAIARACARRSQAGFDRVFLTILDTHVASLISAAFLFQFGTGPIRGFATTLTIGLLTNVFTAVFVSRTLFELVLGQAGTAQAQHLADRESSHADFPQHELRLHPVALARAIALVGADHRWPGLRAAAAAACRSASTSRAAPRGAAVRAAGARGRRSAQALDAVPGDKVVQKYGDDVGAPDHDPPAAGQRRREGVQPRAGREARHRRDPEGRPAARSR